MERIYKATINGNEYEVFGEYWETRQAWGHNAIFMKNGIEVTRARVRYYNRTWESYRFQSAGHQAVGVALDELAARLFEAYRERTGRKRLTEDLKTGILEASQDYAEIKQVYEAL